LCPPTTVWGASRSSVGRGARLSMTCGDIGVRTARLDARSAVTRLSLPTSGKTRSCPPGKELG
jgi:hypothetical protein